MIFLGSSTLPVLFAGQCSVQRPHSTQENACSATILRDVFAGIEPEIFVAGERRNAAETVPLEEDRDRAQHQVQMLGVRNQRQKNQQRQRVQPTSSHVLPRLPSRRHRYAGQIRHHQDEESAAR